MVVVKLLKLLLFFFAFFPIAGYADLYGIASGSVHGRYYRVGELIASSVTAKNDHVLVNIQSSGSIENLSLLQSGLADFAILQHDFATKIHFEDSQYKNFSVLAPLFPEIAQITIFGAHLKQVKDFSLTGLLELFRTDQIEAVYTENGLGTGSQLIHTLLKLYGLDTSEINFQFLENKASLQCRTLCLSSQISSLSHIQQHIGQGNHRYISISENEHAQLARKLVGFDWFKVSIHGQPEFYSLGTWAILIASHTIDFTHDEIQNQLINVIPDALEKTREDQSSFTVSYKGSNGDFILIDKSNLDDVSYPALKELPLGYRSKTISKNWNLIGGVIAIFLLIYLVRRTVAEENRLILWYRYQHFCYALGILIVSILIFSAAIYFFERQLSTEIGRSTAFSTLDLADLTKWLCIFASTGFNNDIFPISNPGQIFATISPYIGYAAAFSAIVAEFLLQRKTAKRNNGELKLSLKNHIIICGINDQCSNFVKGLLHAFSEHGKEQPEIVLITNNVQEILASHSYLERLHKTRKLEFIGGHIRNPSVLEASNVHLARTVYLLSEDGSIECDEKTLLRALSISRHCRTINKNVDSIYMVAEISNPEFVEPLKNADVNEIVNTSTLCEKVLLQSTFNPGVSQVVESLFSFDEYDELYTLPVSSSSNLQNKTFDELAVELRKSFISLIGIRVQFEDITEKLILDDALISARLKELRLPRTIITNPIDENELIYKTKRMDALIVLARDTKALAQI